MRRIALLLSVIAVLMAPIAKADMTYIGSQAGLCCFNVDLHELTNAVQVTVTLTNGAQFFVETGANHPGFAFNLTGAAITASDLSSISLPWTDADFHTSVTTNGPALGVFDYHFDNPGPGASQANPGPLVFTVNRPSIVAADFVANGDGFFFAADIMNAAGLTGESGINLPPHLPEPGSILLLGMLLGLGTLAGRKLDKRA